MLPILTKMPTTKCLIFVLFCTPFLHTLYPLFAAPYFYPLELGSYHSQLPYASPRCFEISRLPFTIQQGNNPKKIFIYTIYHFQQHSLVPRTPHCPQGPNHTFLVILQLLHRYLRAGLRYLYIINTILSVVGPMRIDKRGRAYKDPGQKEVWVVVVLGVKCKIIYSTSYVLHTRV